MHEFTMRSTRIFDEEYAISLSSLSFLLFFGTLLQRIYRFLRCYATFVRVSVFIAPSGMECVMGCLTCAVTVARLVHTKVRQTYNDEFVLALCMGTGVSCGCVDGVSGWMGRKVSLCVCDGWGWGRI